MDTEVCNEARLDELVQDERDPEFLLAWARAEYAFQQHLLGLPEADFLLLKEVMGDGHLVPPSSLTAARFRQVFEGLQRALAEH